MCLIPENSPTQLSITTKCYHSYQEPIDSGCEIPAMGLVVTYYQSRVHSPNRKYNNNNTTKQKMEQASILLFFPTFMPNIFSSLWTKCLISFILNRPFNMLKKRKPEAQNGIACAKARGTAPNCSFNLQECVVLPAGQSKTIWLLPLVTGALSIPQRG